MRGKRWLYVAAMVAGALFCASDVDAATKEKPKYYCETDADCKKNFPDTVCIIIETGDSKIGKCTPNTKSRPACRGGQPGLCPSYQDPESEYLNTQCIFVASEDVPVSSEVASDTSSGAADETTPTEAPSGSGATTPKPTTKKPSTASSGSGPAPASARLLMSEAETTTKPKPTPKPASGSASAAGSVEKATESSAAEEKPKATGSAKNLGKLAQVVIANKTITGYFTCVDVSDCENKAADPDTCAPKECGASGANKMMCNNQGTCTYPSIQTMNKRRCMCYKGFKGDKCQQESSNECDVDCGIGGDCVSGECVCKKGYDGKSYKGKKGKPSQRCTRCTSDYPCQNDNSCNIETGKCECASGFFGPTCGATEDGCTKITCGNGGNCQLLANGTGACFCKKCNPECEMCEDHECLSCPSKASSLQYSKSVLFASAVVAVLLGNLAY